MICLSEGRKKEPFHKLEELKMKATIKNNPYLPQIIRGKKVTILNCIGNEASGFKYLVQPEGTTKQIWTKDINLNL